MSERDIYSERVAWGYAESQHTDLWHSAPSREEAEYLAGDYENGGWICEGRWLSAGNVAALASQMDDILERMNEYDTVQIGDEDTFEPKDGAEAALVEVLSKWAEEHLIVRYWQVTGEPIRVEPPVVAEATR